MKIIALAVLVVLSVSTVPLVHVPSHADTPVPSLSALDVCGGQGSCTIASGDLPFLCESPYKPVSLMSSCPSKTSGSFIGYPLVVLQQEQPPEL